VKLIALKEKELWRELGLAYRRDRTLTQAAKTFYHDRSPTGCGLAVRVSVGSRTLIFNLTARCRPVSLNKYPSKWINMLHDQTCPTRRPSLRSYSKTVASQEHLQRALYRPAAG